VDDAINALVSSGIPVIVAAGNDGENACGITPASAMYAFPVGASDEHDQVPSFSNQGSCVSVFAPGVDIRSLWNQGNGSTKILSGTSMASPHVVGVAALFLAEKTYANAFDLYVDLRKYAVSAKIEGLWQGSPSLMVDDNQDRGLSVTDTSGTTTAISGDGKNTVAAAMEQANLGTSTPIVNSTISPPGGPNALSFRGSLNNDNGVDGSKSCMIPSLSITPQRLNQRSISTIQSGAIQQSTLQPTNQYCSAAATNLSPSFTTPSNVIPSTRSVIPSAYQQLSAYPTKAQSAASAY